MGMYYWFVTDCLYLLCKAGIDSNFPYIWESADPLLLLPVLLNALHWTLVSGHMYCTISPVGV